MATYKRIDGDYVITTLNSSDSITFDSNEVGISGNLDIGGDFTVAGAIVFANVSANNITATNISGNIITASQPFITSLGTLANLTVSGNLLCFSTLAGANVVGTRMLAGDIETVNLEVTTAANIASLNVVSNIAAGFYFGDGGYLSNVTSNVGSATKVANVLSQVNIPVANGNILFDVATTANVMTVDQFGITVQGKITGDLEGSVLADDSSILVDASTSTHYGAFVGDLRGSVFADDSAVIVDAINNEITVGSVAILDALTAGGNITGNYFFGNGSQLTGISVSTDAIFSGTSRVEIISSGGNIIANVAGNTIQTWHSAGTDITGNMAAGNIAGTNISGTLTTAAQTNITSVGTLTSLTVNGLTTHTGNIDITGNINVTGNLNYQNVTDLVVGDPLIFLGANNTGNLYDLGFVAEYNDGTQQHTGLARDHTDGVWKLFANVIAQPTTTIDWANAVYDEFKAGAIDSTATITATGNITGGNIITAGNISANYFIGNGSQLSGIDATSIQSGTSSMRVLTSGGDIAANIAGNVVGTFNSSGLGVIGITNANANGVGNIGNSTTYFNTVFAKATSAQYADLAELYLADGDYGPGTVMEFGGEQEITICDTANSHRVAGVVSENPAHVMNAGLTGDHVTKLALIGRVRCLVHGPVRSGDILVSDIHGWARVNNDAAAGRIIGKSLANSDQDGYVEIVVGKH